MKTIEIEESKFQFGEFTRKTIELVKKTFSQEGKML